MSAKGITAMQHGVRAQQWKVFVLIAAIALFCPVWSGAQDILISEFQARNNNTVQDKDGMYPDWFELYNADTVPVNLSGWFATDDPADLRRWRFPAEVLQPGDFLLVFASGKDIRDAGQELHTNFKLSSEGEYVALVGPDGNTIVWEYGTMIPATPPDPPTYTPYPPQPADYSYGIPMGGVFFKFVKSGDSAKTLVPSDGNLGLTWTDPDFNDAGWITGTTGIGYENSSGYDPLIGTDVGSQMSGGNTSCYTRISFTVDDPSQIDNMTLRMKYDDGFVAYINGTRVAGAHDPSPLAWNSTATADHPDGESTTFQTYNLVGAQGLLRAGTNVLAIHGLNRRSSSSDFLIIPELDGTGAASDEIHVDEINFFDVPTPGSPNVQGYVELADRPVIQTPGGIYMTTSLSIAMSVASGDTEIRYTTNGSIPTASSTRYTGPFTITGSTLVRARGFRSGMGPSPSTSVGYIGLASDARNFTSDVPIVLLENFGGGRPPDEPKRAAFMAIFEPPKDPETGQVIGRASLANEPDLQTRIGIEIRGSSTGGRDKASYGIDGWDEDDEEKGIEVLGMPEHSDWVLYGAYNFDRALMRNHLIYHLSNDCGRYATRSKFCEVFFNMQGGSLSYADYRGVYSFMEKISRDEKRVDVEGMPGDVSQEPEITGGYMMKIDRGSARWNTSRQGSIVPVYPREWNVTSAQNTWIRNYLQEFEDTLFSANFRHPTLGYPRYVDLDSWTDHHILNLLPMNVDAIRLSGYFYKTRAVENDQGALEGGRIEWGPIWDFDRSMGSTDSRDDNWAIWYGPPDSSKYFDYDGRYPWWNRLWQDVDARQRWRDRWHMFRQGPLSTAHIMARIDGFANELREAAPRNFQKWGLINPSQFQNEVNVLKNWLSNRANWVDTHWIEGSGSTFTKVTAIQAPRFSSPGGLISPGFQLTITGSGGTIYYVTDGTDPRASGGGIAQGARNYAGPITINDNARVVARVRKNADHWSPPTADTYVVTPTSLVITEIMYHPPDGPDGTVYEDNDYEYLELFNRGGSAIDLSGVSFTNGVRFEFPEGTLLFPGRYAVVVRNLDAFRDRYPNWTEIVILGEYTGSLQNRGEQIVLMGPLQEIIVDLTYTDNWFGVDDPTDGDGHSLSVVDPYDPRDLWNDPQSWSPSEQLLGTPGLENSASPGGWQLPGDINQDGQFDISDPVGYLRALFLSQTVDPPCDGDLQEGGNLELLDLNDDDAVDLADAVWGLTHLFAGGPPPAGGTACILIQGCRHACTF